MKLICGIFTDRLSAKDHIWRRQRPTFEQIGVATAVLTAPTALYGELGI
jgi:hypothetical protein